MNFIRRSAWAWAAVMLGGVVGCGGGEETNAPPAPDVSAKQAAGPGRKLEGPGDRAKPEPSKEAASKEMTPPPPPADTSKGGDQPKLEPPKTEGKAEGKGDTAAAKLTADEIATIKQLPAADQELALKQVVCPVSGDHLGEMGKPHKTTVEGRTVFLCCDSCEPKIKANPKEYLAKLDKAAAKK